MGNSAKRTEPFNRHYVKPYRGVYELFVQSTPREAILRQLADYGRLIILD